MVCSSCGLTYDDYCSSNLCSSCCLNTAHTDCSSDCSWNVICPSGVTWGIDVAQFSTNTQCCDDYLGHTINIHNRSFLTLTQFQQMFYSDHKNLSTANPPQCDTSFCLISSPWICPSGNTHRIIPLTADYWSNGQSGTVFGPSSTSIMIPQNGGVQWCPNRTDYDEQDNNPWIHIYQIPTATADYVGWGGRYGWIPMQLLLPTTWTPRPRYYNYNCLGGQDQNYSLLGYIHDYSSTPFKAQKTIMDNMIKDLDASLNCWDLCTRASIYDQLHNLCFSNEHSLNNCLEIKCARTWKEVIDAFPPSQPFTLQYSNVDANGDQAVEGALGDGIVGTPGTGTAGTINNITFSYLPCDNATADAVFAGNGIYGPEKQGVWVTRIQHATNPFPDASRNNPFTTSWAYPYGPWNDPANAALCPWQYDTNANDQSIWNIQPNTPYKITLVKGTNTTATGTVTWDYNVVNVGDFVSMRINAKIHNDHCKINTNTIKINYICKVDQELSDYCGTPVSSNRGFKQDSISYYGGPAAGVDLSETFNGTSAHPNPNTNITLGGVDDGGFPGMDLIIPTATMTLADATLDVGQTTTLTIVFSEFIIGFMSDNDVTCTDSLGNVSGSLATMTTTDNITWKGDFTAGNSNGTGFKITLGTNWSDLGGNIPTWINLVVNYTVTGDIIPPTASINTINNAPFPSSVIVTSATPVWITFSEVVTLGVGSVATSTGGTLSAFTALPNGITWTGIFNAPAAGAAPACSITVGTNWTDIAGNGKVSTEVQTFLATGL